MNNNLADDPTMSSTGSGHRGTNGMKAKDGWCLPSKRRSTETTTTTTTSTTNPVFEDDVVVAVDGRNPSPTTMNTTITMPQQPQPPVSSTPSSSPFFTSLSRVDDEHSFLQMSAAAGGGGGGGREGRSMLLDSSQTDNLREDNHDDDDDDGDDDGDDDNAGAAEEQEVVDDDLAVAMRLQREEEESIRLAQQLMAEEAMASYQHMAQDYLRNNQGQFSEADLAALQSAMDDGDDDNHTAAVPQSGRSNDGGGAGSHDATSGGIGADDGGMAYELMMRLGENLGDVKTERWTFVAKDFINALPVVPFDPDLQKGSETNDCDVKCLICQYDYEKGESLRRLPCNHCFHQECVDEWLQTHDSCPYCKKTIRNDDN